jgi:hypothetical protein
MPGLDGGGHPAFRPAAALRVAQQPVVRFSLTGTEATMAGATFDTLPETTSAAGARHTFDGAITIPSSTPEGRYRLWANSDQSQYGFVEIVVGAALPDTGAAHTGSMLKIALMFGITGAFAVAGGVVMARRA